MYPVLWYSVKCVLFLKKLSFWFHTVSICVWMCVARKMYVYKQSMSIEKCGRFISSNEIAWRWLSVATMSPLPPLPQPPPQSGGTKQIHFTRFDSFVAIDFPINRWCSKFYWCVFPWLSQIRSNGKKSSLNYRKYIYIQLLSIYQFGFNLICVLNWVALFPSFAPYFVP